MRPAPRANIGAMCWAAGRTGPPRDLVRAQTKASSSHGTCTGLVEHVMALRLGDSFPANANPPMYKCTDHTDDDVRRMVRLVGLKSIAAVMQELG